MILPKVRRHFCPKSYLNLERFMSSDPDCNQLYGKDRRCCIFSMFSQLICLKFWFDNRLLCIHKNCSMLLMCTVSVCLVLGIVVDSLHLGSLLTKTCLIKVYINEHPWQTKTVLKSHLKDDKTKQKSSLTKLTKQRPVLNYFYNYYNSTAM